jgi:tetratricopeptide (TPR) repeat protein
MAFVALFNQQPGEASMLARAALHDAHLTGRQQVIFELREARAMAQLGAGSEAIRAAEHAAARYWDGATREDPKWSWWVDTSEIEGHVAWAYVEAGEPARAVPMLQRAIEACPPNHANNHFFRLSRHLGATVDVGAWDDAEEILRRLLPYAAEVRSGRAVRLLRGSVNRVEAKSAPARLREAARHLGDVLTAS